MSKLLLTGFIVVIFTVTLAPAAFAGDGALLGTLVGAGAGGYVGSMFGRGNGRIATTGAGVLIGGVAGHEIGQTWDRSNYGYYTRGYYAAPYYPSSYETSPDYYYAPRYVPTYVAPPDPPPTTYISRTYDTYCREYSQTVRIGNTSQESYGTACLQPDGSWKIVQ